MTKPRSIWVKPNPWPAVTLLIFAHIVAVGAGLAYVHLHVGVGVFLTLLASGLVWPLTLLIDAYRHEFRLWRAAVRGDAPWQMRSGR